MKKLALFLLTISSISLAACSNDSNSSSSISDKSTITINYNDGSEAKTYYLADKEEYNFSSPTQGVYQDKYFLGFYNNDTFFPSSGTWDISKGNITLNALWGDNKDITRSFASYLTKEDIKYTYTYKPSSFMSDKADKDLAIISYASSLTSMEEELVKDFYQELAFDDIKTYNYDVKEVDNIAFTLANKKINDKTILAVAIRSGKYGVEWSNNFKVGETGDHEGFTSSANKVVEELNKYINNEQLNKNDIKLWINGYSRGGGVSNIVAHKLIKDNIFTDHQVMAYTFEAPRGIVESNIINATHVYNFYNECDVVAAIPPSEYLFAREGKDINIYKNNIDEIFKNTYGIDLPSFTATSNFQNDQELLAYVLRVLLTDLGENGKDMHDRAHYYANYQSAITYLIELYFNLDQKVIDKVISEVKKIYKEKPVELMKLLSEDGLYNFLSPILDEYKVSFDKTKLKDYTNVIVNFVTTAGISVAASLVSNLTLATRFMGMHFPEVNYALLKDLDFASI